MKRGRYRTLWSRDNKGSGDEFRRPIGGVKQLKEMDIDQVIDKPLSQYERAACGHGFCKGGDSVVASDGGNTRDGDGVTSHRFLQRKGTDMVRTNS